MLNDKLSSKVWDNLEEFYTAVAIAIIMGVVGCLSNLNDALFSGRIRGLATNLILGLVFHVALWLTDSPSEPFKYDNLRFVFLGLATFFHGRSAGPFIQLFTTIARDGAVRIHISSALYTIAIFAIGTYFALSYPEGKYLWLEKPLKVLGAVLFVSNEINEQFDSTVLLKIDMVLGIVIAALYIPFATDKVIDGFKKGPGPGADMDFMMEAAGLFVVISFMYMLFVLLSLKL